MNRILKYPGSKWNIAPKLVELIPQHHSYLEPYAGSMALLFCKTTSPIETVNDLDGDVVNLFQCIQQDSERLARLVMTTPFSREVYEKQYSSIDGGSRFQKAVRFLIKCWQGYGFRTNGSKVGWKNDVQGRERGYTLWDWYRLPERIIDTAERLRLVQIECRPAIEVIKRFDFDNVFMYLDPPYVLKSRSSRRSQYKYEMTDSDHEELLSVIVQSNAKVMISGYESDLYNSYLRNWERRHFLSCSEFHGTKIETVWMNYEQNKQMTLFDFKNGFYKYNS